MLVNKIAFVSLLGTMLYSTVSPLRLKNLFPGFWEACMLATLFSDCLGEGKHHT